MIDFEKDQQEVIKKTDNIQSLADQVERLESLQSRLDLQEENIVYVIQEIPGTQAGNPKINIMGASQYGKFKFLLPEFSQIIFSPGPLVFKLRKSLKDFKEGDYLLLTGDPAIIGVACSIVSDITNGKYNLLKWDKQERKYYPISINLYEKGELDDWFWKRPAGGH